MEKPKELTEMHVYEKSIKGGFVFGVVLNLFLEAPIFTIAILAMGGVYRYRHTPIVKKYLNKARQSSIESRET